MSSRPNDTISSETSSRTSMCDGKSGYAARYRSNSARAASANAPAVTLLVLGAWAGMISSSSSAADARGGATSP